MVKKQIFVIAALCIFLLMSFTQLSALEIEEKKQTVILDETGFISVKIVKPHEHPLIKNFLYVNNRVMLPLFKTRIIGAIDIAVDVFDKNRDDDIHVEYVEFYVNDELKANITTPIWPGLYSWTWGEKVFGKKTIKVIACDTLGNRVSDKQDVIIFNFNKNNTESRETHGLLYYCDSGGYGGGFEGVASYYANMKINTQGIGTLILEPTMIGGYFNKIFKLKYKIELISLTEQSMHLLVNNRWNVILEKNQNESLKDFYYGHYVTTYGPALPEERIIGQIDPLIFGLSRFDCIDLRLPNFR